MMFYKNHKHIKNNKDIVIVFQTQKEAMPRFLCTIFAKKIEDKQNSTSSHTFNA